MVIRVEYANGWGSDQKSALNLKKSMSKMCAKLYSKKDMQSKFDSESATVAVKISYQLFGMDLSFTNLLDATF